MQMYLQPSGLIRKKTGGELAREIGISEEGHWRQETAYFELHSLRPAEWTRQFTNALVKRGGWMNNVTAVCV